MLKKFWAWLLLSSSDPAKASLMIKSSGYAAVTYVVFFTGLFHRPVGAGDVQSVVDQVANLVGFVLMGISAVVAGYGAVMKVWRTLVGTNQVVNTGTTL